jgi:hypothetical protein
MRLTKSYLRQLVQEAASEYVWGVKKPTKVANQYRLSTHQLKQIIKETLKDYIS